MSNKKKIILNIFMFLLYFIYQLATIAIVNLFNIDISNNHNRELYLLISSLIYFVIILPTVHQTLI